MGKPYEIRRIRGRDHKICRGPTHEEPAWLPANQFRERSDGSGRLRGWCNRCESCLRNGNAELILSGYFPMRDFIFAVFELERRLGRAEAARRVGVGKTTWYRWTRQRAKLIQAAKAAMLVSTLLEVREAHEVWSKRDIAWGRRARGLPESPPANDRDYYVSSGDQDVLNRYGRYSDYAPLFTTSRRKHGGNGKAAIRRKAGGATSSSRT